MNSNHYFNSFYAQERINARLDEAESHRLARRAREENGDGFAIEAAAKRAYHWSGRMLNQAVQALEALGEARVTSLQR